MTSITLQPDKITFDGHAGKPEVCKDQEVILPSPFEGAGLSVFFLCPKRDGRKLYETTHWRYEDEKENEFTAF